MVNLGRTKASYQQPVPICQPCKKAMLEADFRSLQPWPTSWLQPDWKIPSQNHPAKLPPTSWPTHPVWNNAYYCFKMLCFGGNLLYSNRWLIKEHKANAGGQSWGIFVLMLWRGIVRFPCSISEKKSLSWSQIPLESAEYFLPKCGKRA